MLRKKPAVMNEGFTRLVKHGGSYRISIAPSLRKALTLNLGDYLHLWIEGERIVIEKATPSFTERKMG